MGAVQLFVFGANLAALIVAAIRRPWVGLGMLLGWATLFALTILAGVALAIMCLSYPW